MAQEFTRATSGKRAYRFFLRWDHGTSAKEHIAPIAGMEKGPDGKLYTYYLVNEETRTMLLNKGYQVSPRIKSGYKDGAGREYRMLPLHVGIVDLPVVGGQGEFVELAQRNGGSGMDFDRLLKAVNALLNGFGVTLPEQTTEDNFTDMVEMIVQILTSSGQLEEQPDEVEEPDGTPDDSEGTQPAAATSEPTGMDTDYSQHFRGARNGAPAFDYAGAFKSLETRLLGAVKASETRFNKRLSDFSQRQTSHSKTGFLARVTELAGKGILTAGQASNFIKKGEKLKWDTSLLPGDDAKPVVDFAQASASAASSKAPKIGGSSPPLTQEEINKRAAKIGAIVKPEK
jgi:hypothetical protein